MAIFNAKPPAPKTTPIIGCNTCRIAIDPANVNKWYSPQRGKWVYRIKCHGQTFEEERIPHPTADHDAIRVGTWTPVFTCPTCKTRGIRATALKVAYPVPHQTTFRVEHCGTLYHEAFITTALEEESGLRARGMAKPNMDDVELSNYQGISPFMASDLPPPKPAFVPAFHKDPATGLWCDKQGNPLSDELQATAKHAPASSKTISYVNNAGDTIVLDTETGAVSMPIPLPPPGIIPAPPTLPGIIAPATPSIYQFTARRVRVQRAPVGQPADQDDNP